MIIHGSFPFHCYDKKTDGKSIKHGLENSMKKKIVLASIGSAVLGISVSAIAGFYIMNDMKVFKREKKLAKLSMMYMDKFDKIRQLKSAEEIAKSIASLNLNQVCGLFNDIGFSRVITTAETSIFKNNWRLTKATDLAADILENLDRMMSLLSKIQSVAVVEMCTVEQSPGIDDLMELFDDLFTNFCSDVKEFSEWFSDEPDIDK